MSTSSCNISVHKVILAHLQNTYWTIQGRIIARRVVNKCITCFRARPTMLETFMAPLPRKRVTKNRVFTKSGVDLCGPFMNTSWYSKSRPNQALCCIVCLTSNSSFSLGASEGPFI